MEKNGETGTRGRFTFTLIFLSLASLMLLLGSIYIMKEFAIIYGVGTGAIVQGLYDNATIAPSVSLVASQLQEIHTDLLEAYALTLVSLALMGGAFVMLIRRNERSVIAQSKYVPYHAAMTGVYVLLLYLILSSPYITLQYFYMDVVYAGIVICFACDAFLEYTNRTHAQSRGVRMRRTMAMDPSKPFSNMLNLQESIFSNLSGHLRIVDKHFNTTSFANLHRLIDGSKSNFTKITILTSKEMLDSGITSSVSDFRNEIGANGIGLEVRLMDEKDTVDQHERLLLDDSIAYKLPPFNIINKKSEHITTISYSEASRRFKYLYDRAIKLDNYMEKQARDNGKGEVPREPAGQEGR